MLAMSRMVNPKPKRSPAAGCTPSRILVLSASAGAGHVRAAQAIERALVATGRVREVRHVDILQYTSKLFRRVYAQAYLDLVNRAPDVLGWLYDYFDEPWKHARLRLALEKLNATRFIRLLEDYAPDWAVSTHFLPAELIAWLRSKKRLATRQAVVVTDFDVQGMWLTRHVDRYFVALDETRVHMERLGVPPAAITVSGIPIDPVFAEPKDARAMRTKHGLAPDRTTILVSAGGFGVGPVEALVHTLLELRHPVQLVVICGRSETLKRQARRARDGQAPWADPNAPRRGLHDGDGRVHGRGRPAGGQARRPDELRGPRRAGSRW